MSSLEPLFSPKSIAVIGASTKAGSVGQAVLQNLLEAPFQGKIYPVNPKAKDVLGVPSFESVSAIPEAVDLATIIVPSKVAPAVMEECGKKGVKSAIIISAGFKEVGEEGKRLEQETVAVARKYGIPLIGPNCLGVINGDTDVRLNASFATHMPLNGSIAFVSQSGAICTAVLDFARAEGIGFSKFISMGNKADLKENDLLRYLKDDPKTKVILLYLEDLADGRGFIEIAREITGELDTPKPILAIKSGRTSAGAKAASSHTGSLAGQDEVYDAIFAQSGVMRVDSVKELFGYGVAFDKQPLPKSNRVAIITNAGGPGIMATDACVRRGLELAALEPSTVEELKKWLPPTANFHNPVDVIGDAQSDRYEHALSAVFQDPNVDGSVVILTPQAMTDTEAIGDAIGRESKKHHKPVIACFMGAHDVSAGVKKLEEHGIPRYQFPEEACHALAAMSNYSKRWLTRPRTGVQNYEVDKQKALDIIAQARKQGRKYLLEVEAGDVLRAYGIPVVQSVLAPNLDAAKAAAQKCGYPVVIKISSKDILHKKDVGGVALNIEDADHLALAHGKMMSAVKQNCPDADIAGVTVQPMSKGCEVIIGMKRDERFGPMVMFGLGGTFVEVFKDVTFRLAPIRIHGATRMVESIKAHKLLEGYRGDAKADIASIEDALKRVSQLAVELDEIAELDINPLVAFAEGEGVLALDSRIILREQE
ncbi:MAG: acetate--CoA ligase [Candidatus Omnitrophica bacterium]|nr:acetate--CoA ligase [Candidatus Omnitrophota bacterium]